VTALRTRKASPEDAEAIAHVQVDTWRTTYRGVVPDEHLEGLSYERGQEMWERILSDTKEAVFVAQDSDDSVVGFASCGSARGAEKEYAGELYAIYVTQAMQGKGIGRMLCQEVVRYLKGEGLDSMLVWVLAENPFRRFYAALGGKHVRTRDIAISGKPLTEWGFGWKNVDSLT
jgi:ribosomal protein S18 acetylase RimI-like enzyme